MVNGRQSVNGSVTITLANNLIVNVRLDKKFGDTYAGLHR